MAMPQLLFPTFDLTEKEVEVVTQVYESLKAAHQRAEFDFDFQPALLKYEAFCFAYDQIHCGPVLRLETDPSGKYLCFLHVCWTHFSGGYSSEVPADFQTWGIAKLQRKYGHVLIRPETTLDKIRELIHHVDIDFEEDKAFSDRFYVLANEEDSARALLGPGLRQTVMGLQLKDFVIEVIDDVMIVGDNKRVDPATACEVASFLCGLSRMT